MRLPRSESGAGIRERRRGGPGFRAARTVDRRSVEGEVRSGRRRERIEMERDELREAGIPVLAFDGVIDARNAQSFRKAVLGAVEEEERCVVLDLEEVAYVASAGFQAILEIDRFLRRRDISLSVTVSEPVLRVVAASGMDRVVRFGRSRNEAPDELDAHSGAASA